MSAYAPVECFWVEPNGKAIRSLRRYSNRGGRCPYKSGEYSYHDKSVEIGEFDAVWTDEPATEHRPGARFVASISVEEYEGDKRWPTQCECGYVFTVEDHWQVNQEPIYEAKDGRAAWVHPSHGRSPTPGAMFDTHWRPELRKEDGLAISVVCQDGTVWCIDDEATSGGYWKRTGEPPNLTVEPSIQTPKYHGFLQDGVLTASL